MQEVHATRTVSASPGAALVDERAVAQDRPRRRRSASRRRAGRRSCPSARRTRWCRRSRGSSCRPRGGRCRRSSRRRGSRRSGGRCRSWCRSRARRGSGRRDPCRASPAGTRRRARPARSTTRPSRNSSVTSSTTTPRGEVGIVKRITPSAERSCGPVKTSPDGMLRLPSELTHTRSATSSRRSVPSPRMWISRAGASRAISPAWNARSSPHAATGSSRSRNSARSTKSSSSRVPIPACCAAAAVGHSVIAQRLASRSSRSGACARAARASRAGSTEASALALSVAWIRSDASSSLRRGQLGRRHGVQLRRRATARQKPSDCPGSATSSSGQAPRSSTSRCSASSSGAASVVDAIATCWPSAAPRGSSRSAAVRSRRRSLRRLHVGEVLGEVRAQHARGSSAAPRPRRSGSARAAPSGA